MNINELNPETLKKLGLKKPRTKTFTAENERSYAIKGIKCNSRFKTIRKMPDIKKSIINE